MCVCGHRMYTALLTLCPSVSTVAEMAAIGLGLPGETFKGAGRYG